MEQSFDFDSISLTENTLTLRSVRCAEPCRIVICADFHYATDDSRGEAFRCYSARMAQYGPQEMTELEQTLQSASAQKYDAVLLVGDMLNFPGEAGVERLSALMKDSPVPCYYIAGNHDWHYEGVPGSDVEQRSSWIRQRLLPLYAGHDPMGYSVMIKGIKFILLDNSVYEILPEQLDFFRRELAEGLPAILCMHIPLYLPPHSAAVGYGCGNPNWGKEDLYWQVERRQRWPESGPSETTLAFHHLAFTSPNLLGIIAGHTHEPGLDQFNGRFQLVSRYRAPLFLQVIPR